MSGFPGGTGIAVVLCCSVQLAGCTEAQAVQDWISPPTPREMNARLHEQAAAGHPAEALAAAETFLVQHPADAHELHRAMAQMYLAHGDADAAVRHLMLASTGTGLKPSNAPPEGPRQSADGGASLAPPPAPFGAAVDGASAQFLPDGSLSVRAGDASASTARFSR